MRQGSRPNRRQEFETCPARSIVFGADEPSEHSPVRRPLKIPKIRHPITDMETLEANTKSNTHIEFKMQPKTIQKEGPGVGNYDIAIPIIRPAYETYEKGNNIVLVKINHIGGTSSFCNEK
jgi:hypothetical protein